MLLTSVGWKNSRYSTPFGDGFYTEVCWHPLADDSAITSYRAPDPDKAEAVLDIPFRYHLRAAERLVRMGVDMIWIGDEVLNPVQPLSMDPVQLKREYGKKLCFWGTIDEQRTLPFGTTEEVRAEVISRLSTIGKGRRPHQSAPYPPCSARHPCGEPASSCGCGLLHDLRLL